MYHTHALTTQKAGRAFTTFLLEKNLLVTFFKILSLKNILIYFPYVFGMRLIALLRDIITFNFGSAFARLKAILWLIFNISLIHKKRKETQKFRKADDDYILKVFSEKYLFRKKFIV